MSPSFTFSGFNTNPDSEAYQYTHRSGLTHFNIPVQNDTERYSGAWFIKTPSEDDSGIAHALEHLVFRQSQSFPNPTTLFQLLALTDVQINASTLDGVTCFHFSSSCREHFYLAARYLLCGILFSVIEAEQCLEEIFDGTDQGVIYRELLGYQSNAHYLQQVQVLRGDQTSQRIACYGGVTDTLTEITLDRLKSYHRRYYRCENIELITSFEHVDELHNILDSVLAQYVAESPKQLDSKLTATPSAPQITVDYGCIANSSCVVSWWLGIEFYQYIKQLEPTLRKLTSSMGVKLLPLTNECNSAGEFALRVLANPSQTETIHKALISVIDTQKAYSHSYLIESAKQPDSIKRLMNFYYSRLYNFDSANRHTLSSQILCPPHISQLAQISPAAQPYSSTRLARQKQKDKCLRELNRVIPQLTEIASGHAQTSHSDNLINQYSRCRTPELPQLLHPLINELDKGINQVVDKHCWLFRLEIPEGQRLIARLSQYQIQASILFLLPRIKGECYVISSHYCEHTSQLYFYSVFDRAPNQRQRHLTQALRGIADDKVFIAQSLPLIKNKIINQHLIKPGAVSPVQLAEIEQGSKDPLDSVQLENLLGQVSETCIRHFLLQLTNEIINSQSHIQG
ncbi:hypothetical protein [Vibrio japonicus]|uniref:Peptidase M16 N-terminal domain-containing protein n=1 Tax=Vibrio japonicus TaxID=1824638 RepID=A0ABY5LID8_9VIBR|nr:hypothetical protein [Vibrio japonicus]UUM29555.1 hypothetical protein NP165_07425 [Vibrio japonicus]